MAATKTEKHETGDVDKFGKSETARSWSQHMFKENV